MEKMQCKTCHEVTEKLRPARSRCGERMRQVKTLFRI